MQRQSDYSIPISDDSPDKKTILLSAEGTVDCLQLRFSCAVQQKLGRQRAVGLGRAHKTHALGSTAFCLGSIGYVQTSVKRRMLPAAVKLKLVDTAPPPRLGCKNRDCFGVQSFLICMVTSQCFQISFLF